jgi:hypothetical protein
VPAPSPIPAADRSPSHQFYGPDAKEVITAVSREYCTTCHMWYRGQGAMAR